MGWDGQLVGVVSLRPTGMTTAQRYKKIVDRC